MFSYTKFPKDFKTEGILKSTEYGCPNCHTPFNDDDEYTVEGVNYPQVFNEVEGGDMDGSYHDWDELHCCEHCKTKYWFRNGAY